MKLKRLQVFSDPTSGNDVITKDFFDDKLGDVKQEALDAVKAVIDDAPKALDTLKEIASQLESNDDSTATLVKGFTRTDKKIKEIENTHENDRKDFDKHIDRYNKDHQETGAKIKEETDKRKKAFDEVSDDLKKEKLARIAGDEFVLAKGSEALVEIAKNLAAEENARINAVVSIENKLSFLANNEDHQIDIQKEKTERVAADTAIMTRLLKEKEHFTFYTEIEEEKAAKKFDKSDGYHKRDDGDFQVDSRLYIGPSWRIAANKDTDNIKLVIEYFNGKKWKIAMPLFRGAVSEDSDSESDNED